MLGDEGPASPEKRSKGRDELVGEPRAWHRECSANGSRPRPTKDEPDLKSRLSIFSALIFDSSVDGGTPGGAAAPNGPATRPLLSRSAASMASFSCPARVLPAGDVRNPATLKLPRVVAQNRSNGGDIDIS